MKLIGIGIDVVEVDRVRSSLDEFGERFLQRIFTPAEQEYCQRQKRPEIHFAARFAAKEAISKAFGTGIGKEIGWLDIEIIRRESGEPEVKLTGDAKRFAEKRGASDVMVSLSHAQHYAAANAVVMGK
ncbi:holo-ACP synthase [Akkermansiaceae bacterium]|nr:holo-ACP synthase [Akkermansiaceae bacterium]MDB4407120.1 holo-ACP synthase [bacterium]MDA8968819.1 holo-ACP synthase [Akkermansiaceae bacterium]MDA8975621.1 holo-ACP synthase [Akkermansiaceae bacterium]MDB4373735.1 holo-ACP synthase [Akkermansiaceae bacterium]